MSVPLVISDCKLGERSFKVPPNAEKLRSKKDFRVGPDRTKVIATGDIVHVVETNGDKVLVLTPSGHLFGWSNRAEFTND